MSIKILWGIPNEGHTESYAYDNRLEMAMRMGVIQGRDGKYDFALSTIGQVLTPIAREKIAETAIDNGFDFLFMIDDDMISPPDLVFKLIEHDVDIVAALAFTRYPPHNPVIYNLTDGIDSITRRKYFINNVVKTYPKDTLVQCDAVGFGAVLIKVPILKRIQEKFGKMFQSTCTAGEDILFCHHAIELGIKVHCDTKNKIGHMGVPNVITEETYEMFNDIDEQRKIYGDEIKYSECMAK
jgi:hypothetical protein